MVATPVIVAQFETPPRSLKLNMWTLLDALDAGIRGRNGLEKKHGCDIFCDECPAVAVAVQCVLAKTNSAAR